MAQAEECIQQATLLKDNGNACFTAASRAAAGEMAVQFTKALEAYDAAIESFKKCRAAHSAALHQPTILTCLLNKAACFLKLERFDDARSCCDQVLAQDTKSAKALFRRGVAYLGLKDPALARRDLLKAKSISPTEEVCKALNDAEQAISAMAATVGDDLPPLDDMQPQLERRGWGVNQGEPVIAPPVNRPGLDSPSTPAMKPGFLSPSPSSKHASSKDSNSSEALPTLTASKDVKSDDWMRLPEVQQAMQANGEWFTPQLMENVMQNPNLVRYLQDGRMSQVLDEMKKDPQAAAAKYQHDKEVAGMLQAFTGILGNHFTGLAAQPGSAPQQQIVPDDPLQRQAEEALSDERIKAILMDSEVKEFFEELRTQNRRGYMRLQNPAFQKKVKVLVDAGLLKLEANG
eukprot:gnl/Hemi2/10724_TR3681_c0_g1_i1.p1 gnl/Hemi2/10724_TR3681_c0_g1~~gnl/Hemi2/10724_TR3681_c0_g1_i1.p1  ORF type:complete len:404 (+),score=66.58 gnl/Hemi2/10724_TR3681_c0_g1_i1:34-1245(+)